MSNENLPYPPPTRKGVPPTPKPPKGEGVARVVGAMHLKHRGDGTFEAPSGSELWKVALQNFDINATEEKIQKRWKEPAILLELVCGYFNWLQENPLQEAKLVSYEGNSSIEEIPHMRVATLQGMCLYIGISRHDWGNIRLNPPSQQVLNVVNFAEQMIHDMKFTGAAVGLLNPSFISKDLGLVERSEVTGGVQVTITGKDGEL